jgi:hypothetical protein
MSCGTNPYLLKNPKEKQGYMLTPVSLHHSRWNHDRYTAFIDIWAKVLPSRRCSSTGTEQSPRRGPIQRFGDDSMAIL